MTQLELGFLSSPKDFDKAGLALLTPEEIYQIADEHLLSTLKEDQRIERKPPTIHTGELGEYFSMWANTSPNGGLIAIGQHDKGQFIGCSGLPQNRINEHEKAGRLHCPDARYATKRVLVLLPDGQMDFVILIRVYYHETRVVRHVSGNAFIRRGDSKFQLSEEDIRYLEIEKGQLDHESEPAPLQFPDDFNMSLVRQYVDSVISTKRLTAGHSDIEILANGRLGKISGVTFIPNTACVLLLARDPVAHIPGCKVRILRYDGELEKTGIHYNVTKDFLIEGPVPELIVGAAKIIKDQLREFSGLGRDGRFYTAPEYPEQAWYEALVNACVHRSYSLRNMVVFVKIFDDRLVIQSPGGFPVNVTPETIYYVHNPRNPHLMLALYFLAFVKCHNEGTRRMRDAMQAMDLPGPEFAQKEVAVGYNSVQVTLRNNIRLRKLWIDSEAFRALGGLAKDAKGKELRILNFVAEYGSINVSQAQRLLVGRWQTLKRLLNGMVQKQLLVYSSIGERDRNACYRLPERLRGAPLN